MKPTKILTLSFAALLLASTASMAQAAGTGGGAGAGSSGTSSGTSSGVSMGGGAAAQANTGTGAPGAASTINSGTTSNVNSGTGAANAASTINTGTGVGVNGSLGTAANPENNTNSTANARTQVDSNNAGAAMNGTAASRADNSPDNYNKLNQAYTTGSATGINRAASPAGSTVDARRNANLQNAARNGAANGVFSSYDSNTDNMLSESEFKTSGRNLTTRSFGLLDSNHDGFLNAAELQSANDYQAKARERSVSAFSGFDTDGDSRLSRGEYTAAGNNIGTGASFASIDANHDGYVSNAELNASSRLDSNQNR